MSEALLFRLFAAGAGVGGNISVAAEKEEELDEAKLLPLVLRPEESEFDCNFERDFLLEFREIRALGEPVDDVVEGEEASSAGEEGVVDEASDIDARCIEVVVGRGYALVFWFDGGWLWASLLGVGDNLDGCGLGMVTVALLVFVGTCIGRGPR